MKISAQGHVIMIVSDEVTKKLVDAQRPMAVKVYMKDGNVHCEGELLPGYLIDFKVNAEPTTKANGCFRCGAHCHEKYCDICLSIMDADTNSRSGGPSSHPANNTPPYDAMCKCDRCTAYRNTLKRHPEIFSRKDPSSL